jgi:cobyrinic acid a,c-diamide synthase
MAVQPFKKGPDFIDPMWLSAAAGRRCRNLDFFMAGRERIVETFVRHSRGADLSLVECNHGLHDGLDLEGSDSSAALARLLEAPVLLVVNAARLTRGIVPLLLGHIEFERDVRIAGIVLNRVSSRRQEEKIRAALGRYCDVPVLGVLPYRPELEIAERHLGLTPLLEDPALASRLDGFDRAVEDGLDLDAIVRIAGTAPAVDAGEPPANLPIAGKDVRLAVAMDRAFNFYYPENLEALEAAGAELVTFSPLADRHLPSVDGLYLGGGFPEFFMDEIEGNVSLRRELHRAIGEGLPVWAECGGLMYLARRMHWRGRSAPMVGVFPCEVEMSERPAGHGYVELEEAGEGPWPQEARRLRGHEFHHSRVTGLDEGSAFAYRTLRGNGTISGRDGLVAANCIATYTHLHHDGAPFWAEEFVSFVRGVKKGR